MKTSSRKIAWKPPSSACHRRRPWSSSLLLVLLPGARCFCCCCPFLSVVRCPFLSVVVVHVSHGCCTNSMQGMCIVVSFVRVSTVTGLPISDVGHPNEQASLSDIDCAQHAHKNTRARAPPPRRRPSSAVAGHRKSSSAMVGSSIVATKHGKRHVETKKQQQHGVGAHQNDTQAREARLGTTKKHPPSKKNQIHTECLFNTS